MIVDPIQSAIAAYKGVDDIFRQGRLDDERKQQQQFQNNLALSQDQRAQQSHQLQMDKVDRQQKLAAVQSLRYRLANKEALTDVDMEILSQDPILSKYFDDPKLIDEALLATGRLHSNIPKLLQDRPAPTQDAKEWIKARMDAKLSIIDDANKLPTVAERLAKSGTPGKIGDFLMHEKGLVIEKKYKEGDKEIVAPLTQNASKDPNDPVNFYNIKDVMTKITTNAKMLDGLKTALEARSVELGDTKLLEDAEKKAKTLNVVTALASTDSFKKNLGGVFGPLLQSGLEMAQAGILDGNEFAKLNQLAITKGIETEIKNDQDEKDGHVTVTGYAALGDTAPRTAQMAAALLPMIQEGKASGKRTAEMLKVVYTSESRHQENLAKIGERQADRALRRELAAGRGGKGGGNGSSTAADRNEIMRIESERKAHEQAVKAAAADVKKYQYEYQDASDSPEKKAAQEKYNAALQRRDAFMARAYPATETQQPTPYKDNVTMQGLTGGGAANNYGYGPRQGVNAPVFSAMPPAGKLTGRTITDTATGKRYTSNGKSWIEVR